MIYTDEYSDKTDKLKSFIESADAIVIGAGAGLSTAAGFTYSGKRFHENFHDFEAKYNFHDMYSGGFYPYDTPEEFWAYWSRYIFLNRYTEPPKPVYNDLFELVKNKIRATFDVRSEKTGKKIRDAVLEKVPYVLLVGDKEENGLLSVRNASGNVFKMSKEQFIEKLSEEIGKNK